MPISAWMPCWRQPACPVLFHAVEIENEAYWDGGYAANPALLPLIAESEPHDLILVQINPVERPGIPRTAHDIIDRINEISFNSSLNQELRTRRTDQALAQGRGGFRPQLQGPPVRPD